MGQPLETQICVFVDPSKRAQTFLGIGGALTEASAETYAKLPAAKQREIMDAYFDPNKGIGYTLGRTNIHSCDFSSGSYPKIQALSPSASATTSTRIPFIKSDCHGRRETPFASRESAGIHETNNDMLTVESCDRARASWANYYTKFIKAYEREGIPIWGISVRTADGDAGWESCITQPRRTRFSRTTSVRR
jgi:glucosylceramidase